MIAGTRVTGLMLIKTAVVLAAALILKESVNIYQIIGIAAVFGGILLMNLKPGGN